MGGFGTTRIQQFERLCRERGLPRTVHRRAVLEIMLDREDHPTADQVYAEMRARLPGISRTSVYRILEMLVSVGMVNKVCHPGSAAARFDPRTQQHHHLVCLSCERIIDVEDPRLNRLPLPDVRSHGFQIDDYLIHFRGVCADCRKALDAGVNKTAQKTRPLTTAVRRRSKARPLTTRRRNKT